MFSGNQKQAKSGTKKVVVNREAAVTILTSGCHFNGKLYCRGSSRIGGKIEGEIVSEGLLIIEEAAVINADVVADEAIIQGVVKGSLTAKGRVELTHTCSFEGNVDTPCLIVHEGAKFNGRAKMPIEEGRKVHLLDQNKQNTPIADPGKDNKVNKQPDVAMGLLEPSKTV